MTTMSSFAASMGACTGPGGTTEAPRLEFGGIRK